MSISIGLMKGFVMRMNQKQRQVYDIMLMPIQNTEYSAGKIVIERKELVIETTQTYYRYKKYPINLDADMSDFAIGFYNILYKDILKNNSLLNSDHNVTDDEFAGDTMNSFNMIANRVPEAGKSNLQRTPEHQWPKWLQDYYHKYHCLANFWVLPLEVGRKSDNANFCKMNFANKIYDYMDRFLKFHKDQKKWNDFKRTYSKYYENIRNFEEFVDIHFLMGSYVDENYEIIEYSNDKIDKLTEHLLECMQIRAEAIAKSKYCDELWKYFMSCGLIQ